MVAKSKPVSVVSRTRSAKQSASLDSGASYGSRSQRLGRNSVFTSAEKSVRDTVENWSSTSQVWHRGENPFSSSGRTARGRPVRGIQNQLARTKLALPQSSNLWPSIPRESLHESSTEVESPWGRPDNSSRMQSFDMKIIYVNNERSAKGTPTSKSSRRFSTSRRSWSWIRITRFWMFPR